MENLGKEGRDKVTGFTGIIGARCEYLYGCAQYMLTPKVNNEGKRIQNEWFDIGRIEITGPGVSKADVVADAPGGEYSEHP